MNFVVARNPDPDSRLPFLVRLPIDGGLILKVRDTWPKTSRVFCARVDGGWPPQAELIEEVPVALCRRRGVAIDLVLQRPRQNRSQFVFTTLPTGREGIFWQTRQVVGTARPGARIPGRRASGLAEVAIVVDSRERYPYRFAKQQATTRRAALQAGDYAVMSEAGMPVAAIERKSLADLAASLNNGTLTFELSKLAELPHAAVVVEDRYGNLLKHAYAPAGFLPDLLARVQVRYPEIPILFLETRPLAEEWTFRYLGAALAEVTSESPASPWERRIAEAPPAPTSDPVPQERTTKSSAPRKRGPAGRPKPPR